MLDNHWKISKEISTKVDFNKAIKKIEKNKVFFNKEFIPEWFKKDSKLFPENILELYNRDLSPVDQFIEDILFERYLKHKKPFYTRFPISYRIVPVFIRNPIFEFIKKRKKVPEFPEWPVDSTVDLLRYAYLMLIKRKTFEKIPYIGFWPDKKDFAICLTHDLETETSFDNIEAMRVIERKYGFKSTWNVLCKRYEIDFEKLKKLEKEGCEIALHGYNHDGKMPYLSNKKIDKRINKCLFKLKDFKVDSFRSAQLQRNEKFLKYISKYFICDSSVPDTEFKSAFAMKSGCCTVFPFMIDGMVEIPLTVPQDFRLIYTLKLNDEDYLKLWKDKIDHIKELGGIVSIVTHPDDYISGNERYLTLYDKTLEYLSKLEKFYHDTQINIAKWWLERNNCKIDGGKITGSERATTTYF